MELYRVESEEQITIELVLALIERYKVNEVDRLQMLEEYYVGDTEVKERTMSGSEKPNNKIASPYASYIVDTTQGYFLGKPIVYSSSEDNGGEDSNTETLLDKVQVIFNKNDEQAHNMRIGKRLATSGVAYELVYLASNKEDIKFTYLDPKETFIIYDDSVEEKPLAGVRFYEVMDYIDETIKERVEIYYKDRIVTLDMVEGEQEGPEETVPHSFGKVPIIQYKNNDEFTGDFEKVKDLIDAYDLAVSDTSNNLEYFADSYLFLSGMEDTEPEDIADMKENRVMIAGAGGEAEWLVKDSQNVEVEEFKDRLKEDIHTLSHVPRLDSDAFGTATSGESLKYKLFGLENIVSMKERFFKEGLETRLELITNLLEVKGAKHDPNTVRMSFTRNIPSNQTALVDMVSKLKGIISDETILSILPFVEDPELELARLQRVEEEEAESLYEDSFPEGSNDPVEPETEEATEESTEEELSTV